MPKPIAATNDFVVKFANVNGSGSASANGLFAKAILRMGVPVGARNIFPSNIQGLPTWYEVRVSEAGWLGRRGGVDLMVAMNPQTWDADVKGIEPGGYILYDSSKPLPASKFRDDITLIGAPLTFLLLATGLVGAERLRRSAVVLSSGVVCETCERVRAALKLSRTVAVAASDRVLSPVLIGIVRPMILLPASALSSRMS